MRTPDEIRADTEELRRYRESLRVENAQRRERLSLPAEGFTFHIRHDGLPAVRDDRCQ